MMWGSYDNGWWWLVMSLGMVAFWGLVAWVIVTVVRSERRETREPPAAPDAERILAERFARGEIDGDEYRQRLADLRAAAGGASKAA